MAEYKLNANYAAEIRKLVYGKPMREPIARSAEFMIEFSDRWCEYYRKKNQERLDKARQKALDDLVPIDQKCATRISDMTITPITPACKYDETMEYHRLTFTRENGT